MLKITKIVSLFVFFLFIGIGSQARAFVKSVQQKTTSSEENQDKDKSSQKDDLEDGPKEVAYQLDLFHAFSLVNAQLKWKDFHFENSGKSISFYPKKRTLESGTFQEFSNEFYAGFQSAVLTSSKSECLIWPVEFEESINAIASTQGETKAKTIIYIQNCGTYPHLIS